MEEEWLPTTIIAIEATLDNDEKCIFCQLRMAIHAIQHYHLWK